MRKNFAAVCAGMLLLALAGCTAAGDGAASQSASTLEQAAQTEPAAEPEQTAETDPAATEAPEQQVTLAETVLYDQDGVRITATGLDMQAVLGPELSFQVENSTQQNLVVQPEWCTVNGYMMSDLFSADVAAGKKANDTMYFPSSSLERCGIDTVTDIAMELKILDGETYQTLATTGTVTLQTSAAGSYTQTYDDSGEEIYNANGIRVVMQRQAEDLFGQEIHFYLENTSDRAVVVQSEDVSVNGYMISNWLYADLIPGAHAVEALTLFTSDMEENGIETIETVELALNIVDAETYQTIEKTAPITLQMGQE